MTVCLFNQFVQYATKYRYTLHVYSATIWILNILLLIFLLLELLARKVKWCKMQHAHMIVCLSMTSSIISSSFFLISDLHISHYIFNKHLQQICLFAPIIAISFRIIAKHFTWALYVVRGQMVMASSSSACTVQFSKKAPYILIIQCIAVTTCIVIFTKPYYQESRNSCQVTLPLWLLTCSALIGETCYGLGFMYIFYKAMTNSLDHIYKTLPKAEVDEVKNQLRHHITIYFIQLISSILFLLFVASCICLETLVFFEAELFISNFCLLLLFRNKITVFKKAIKSCLTTQDSAILQRHLQPLDITQKHSKSSRNLHSLQTRHANKIIRKRNAFASHILANKWISDTEVINVQKEILDIPTKTGIEMFYCKESNHQTTNKHSDDNSKPNSHSRMPTMEALQIITHTLNEQPFTNAEPGHKRNNTLNTAVSNTTTPSFKLTLDTLQTKSAPTRVDDYNTDFQIDSNIASLSAGNIHNVKTPRQRHSNLNVFGIFGSDPTNIVSQSEKLMGDTTNEVDFMQNNDENKGVLKPQTSLRDKFKLAKKKFKMNGLKSQSDIPRHDIANIGKLIMSKRKLPDKQSLINEDFASAEPAELRSTLSSQQHEQYIKQMFTPEMNHENEENMVYSDEAFQVIDDEKNETIEQNKTSNHGNDIETTINDDDVEIDFASFVTLSTPL